MRRVRRRVMADEPQPSAVVGMWTPRYAMLVSLVSRAWVVVVAEELPLRLTLLGRPLVL